MAKSYIGRRELLDFIESVAYNLKDSKTSPWKRLVTYLTLNSSYSNENYKDDPAIFIYSGSAGSGKTALVKELDISLEKKGMNTFFLDFRHFKYFGVNNPKRFQLYFWGFMYQSLRLQPNSLRKCFHNFMAIYELISQVAIETNNTTYLDISLKYMKYPNFSILPFTETSFQLGKEFDDISAKEIKELFALFLNDELKTLDKINSSIEKHRLKVAEKIDESIGSFFQNHNTTLEEYFYSGLIKAAKRNGTWLIFDNIQEGYSFNHLLETLSKIIDKAKEHPIKFIFSGNNINADKLSSLQRIKIQEFDLDNFPFSEDEILNLSNRHKVELSKQDISFLKSNYHNNPFSIVEYFLSRKYAINESQKIGPTGNEVNLSKNPYKDVIERILKNSINDEKISMLLISCLRQPEKKILKTIAGGKENYKDYLQELTYKFKAFEEGTFELKENIRVALFESILINKELILNNTETRSRFLEMHLLCKKIYLSNFKNIDPLKINKEGIRFPIFLNNLLNYLLSGLIVDPLDTIQLLKKELIYLTLISSDICTLIEYYLTVLNEGNGQKREEKEYFHSIIKFYKNFRKIENSVITPQEKLEINTEYFTRLLEEIESDTLKSFLYYFKGRIELANNNPITAITDFTFLIESLHEDEKFSDVLNFLKIESTLLRGIAKTQSKSYNSSITDYTKSLTYYSDREMEININFLLAKSYERNQDHENLVDSLNIILEVESDLNELFFMRGKAQKNLENYFYALDDFSTAIELNPVSTYLYARGHLNYMIGRKKASVVDFDELIKMDSPNSIYYYFRGKSHLNYNSQKAYKDLTKYISKTTQKDLAYNSILLCDALLERAKIDILSRKFTDAEKDLRQAINLRPDYYLGYLYNALLWQKRKARIKSLNNIKYAIKLIPEGDMITWFLSKMDQRGDNLTKELKKLCSEYLSKSPS